MSTVKMPSTGLNGKLARVGILLESVSLSDLGSLELEIARRAGDRRIPSPLSQGRITLAAGRVGVGTCQCYGGLDRRALLFRLCWSSIPTLVRFADKRRACAAAWPAQRYSLRCLVWLHQCSVSDASQYGGYAAMHRVLPSLFAWQPVLPLGRAWPH